MSDSQPLLDSSNKLSLNDDDDNESNKQLTVSRYDYQEKYNELIIFLNSLFDWRRWLSKKKDNDTEQSDQDAPVSVFQLVSVFKREIFLNNLFDSIEVSVCGSYRSFSDVYCYMYHNGEGVPLSC
jgi:hypothetical protein